MAQLTHFFLSMIDHAGYVGLFFVMLLGNVGIPIGAELVLPAAGALTATGHLSNIWLTGAVSTAGELVGGTILYAIGYAGGRPFVVRWGRYLKVDEKKLDSFHTFYERHGSVIVFVCRFLPFVRGFAALPAGVSRMERGHFLAYTAAGSAVFCFGLVWLGSIFGRHFDEIAPHIHTFSTALIVGVACVVAIFAAERVVRNRRKAREGV